MEAAAAASGLHIDIIRWAKAEACPAFRHGRVHMAELKPWIEANRDKLAGQGVTKEQVEIRLKLLKCEAQEHTNALNRKEYVRWATVEEWQGGLGERLQSILSSKLKDELPAKLEGLRAAEIAAKFEGVIEEICKLARAPIQKK